MTIMDDVPTQSFVEQAAERWLAGISAALTLPNVESLRLETLGKSGALQLWLRSLGGMPTEERIERSKLYNNIKDRVSVAIIERKAELEAAALDMRLATERVDMTLPAPEAPKGSVHPVSQVLDELAEIFADMGFAVASGPEILRFWSFFLLLPSFSLLLLPWLWRLCLRCLVLL